MDEQLANLAAAFAEAGLDAPADPTAIALDDLDSMVEDRRLRGKCKSALVKFRRAAEAAGWQPPVADEPALAPAPEPAPETAPEPVAAPAPAAAAPAPEPVAEPQAAAAAVPMSAELQARYDDLVAALQAAGADVPGDLVHMEVGQLDALVEDKQARGKCKSALVKFQRAAKGEGWAPAETAPGATPPPAAAPEPSEPVAEAAPVAPEPEVEEEESPEEEFVAAPMPDALQPLYEAVVAAFAAAGAEPPADPVNVNLDSLDELIENKQLRGKCKAALVKFRRAAEAEGWQAAPAPRPKKAKQAATAAAPSTDTATASATPVPSDVPPEPAAKPTDLFLLTADGWQRLGTATREAQLADEIVGEKTASGATARINSVLILDGTFDVPEDLYNTYCYLAHEGVVYKAYYISHIGDVKRGTKTASLKVDQTFTYDEFARTFVALGKHTRPTADDVRRRRFGRGYDTDRRMFAEPDASRLV